MQGDWDFEIERLSCSVQVSELDRFEKGLADLPPIIQGLEVLQEVCQSATDEWKAEIVVRVSNLKSIYAAVAADFEPWRYHEIQFRLRERPAAARILDSIRALKKLLQNESSSSTE